MSTPMALILALQAASQGAVTGEATGREDDVCAGLSIICCAAALPWGGSMNELV